MPKLGKRERLEKRTKLNALDAALSVAAFITGMGRDPLSRHEFGTLTTYHANGLPNLGFRPMNYARSMTHGLFRGLYDPMYSPEMVRHKLRMPEYGPPTHEQYVSGWRGMTAPKRKTWKAAKASPVFRPFVPTE